jgi:hypothetical protein
MFSMLYAEKGERATLIKNWECPGDEATTSTQRKLGTFPRKT